MRMLVLGVGLAATALLVYNTVALQRRRAQTGVLTAWSWAVVGSRVFLTLPFLALAVSAGRWPGSRTLAWWFGLSAVFMLVADTGDRLAVLRKLRTARRPADLD